MTQYSKADILVVDDTPANLKLLREILNSEGYKVRQLPDGAMVLDAVKIAPPDLILLDINMPGMDGYAVCKQLKAKKQTHDIPIIFISALQETENKIKAFTSGGVDYITKPFHAEEVLARVATHLQLNELRQSLAERNNQLKTLLQYHRSILDSAGEGILGVNKQGNITFINPAAQQQLGFTEQELEGKNLRELIHAEVTPTASPASAKWPIAQTLSDGKTRFVNNEQFFSKKGFAFPVEYTVTALQDEQNQYNDAIIIFRDISQRKHMEQRLREAATVFEVSSDGVVITDSQGVIRRVNQSFTEITGYSADEVIGKMPNLLKSGHHDNNFYATMWSTIMKQGRWEGEIWNRRKNNSIYPEWQVITRINDNEGRTTGFIAQFSEITRRKLTEEEIRYRGNYDILTGLVNRTLLYERLQQAIKEQRRHKQKLSLLFIDLDQFKQVNDSLGHTIGDHLLQQVAKRIQTMVREVDTVARLGGDEFALMLLEQSSPDASERLASSLIAHLSEPFLVDEHEIRIGASIGIAIFPEDGEEVETLFRNADLALYRAKEAGREQFQFYTASMTIALLERQQLEADLRYALAHNELVVYFQPIVDCKLKQLVGVEALVRWIHPVRGGISPGVFIPLAEETGQIKQIGSWVLETTCKQLGQWHKQGYELYASVNVSACQIPESIPLDWVKNLLEQSQLQPKHLVFEITEGILLGDVEQVSNWLTQFRNFGLRIYLDDFGTGYSSLSYLKRFPVDTLKIDRSFVRDMAEDDSDQALIRAILAMSQGLGLQVVAEGIETSEQLELLQDLGCTYVQGYYFSKPLPAEKLLPILQNIGNCTR
ncbi:EAL domain-containing protein [Candidatus Venteria ishoeyi]|uniref:Cyclic di-GMP phosphodiesterase Gmr n=1 Tax=Candidatus Venteria ishoeyi TaxID=1899563 RepID=A0A1H6FJJ3_9GAMM|nr:EAL domain-containing protein [Candidatus Venteria ishoeyi]SEH09194.1 Cyclic di-GMP phosphodiesterase Gmr [Candidatus Venteria ishoeyi]SEH09319.1 Cyclic di-GMP phosphodiesterase Gmr [Candidatus Venteria ishoeyi]